MVEAAPAAPEVVFSPHPGRQTDACASGCREILFGGARGGGKSFIQIGWMARLAVETDGNGRLKYPNYLGLVVRQHADDLKTWVDEAERMYCGKLGAKKVGKPVEFHFPGGPKIYTGHLKEDSSWTKYQGWNVHKLGIDEVTQIPREDRYLLLLGSLRGSPDGIPQAFLTGNPGNIGDAWVRRRFIDVKDKFGHQIQPGQPFKDPITKHTRVYIPATIYDNPTLLQNDPSYVAFLHGLPEAKKRAWLYGDWHAFEGQYFSEFRPQGPVDIDEPPWARHVINSHEVSIQPYAYRWLSMDWGFRHESALYGFANHSDGRIHTYREMIFQETPSMKVGATIAAEFARELEMVPDHHMTLYLSPDAWQQRDGPHTIADNMAQGIQMVIGNGGAFVAKMSDHEKALAAKDPEQAFMAFERRRESESGTWCITIAEANNDRVAGWQYIHDLLRFVPAVDPGEPDRDFMNSLLRQPNGESLVMRYLDGFTRKDSEILPKILIHGDKCPRLVETIPALMHAEKRPEDVEKVDGDDPADGWRYGCMAHRDMQNTIPQSYYVRNHVDRARQELGITDITLLAQVHRQALVNYEKEVATDLQGFTLPRLSGPRMTF